MPDISHKDILMHIGSCVWDARKRKGMSRRILSEISGLSQRFIQHVEKGETNLSCESLSILINALQIPGGYLFDVDSTETDIELAYMIKALERCSVEEKCFICKTAINMVESFEELRKNSSGGRQNECTCEARMD